jgi:hypothetical protein
MSNPNKQLLEQVLADIDSHTNLIPNIEVNVGSTSISNGFISPSSFGPCLAFLMQFTSNGQPQCLLSHFDCGFDEHGMRLYQILEQLASLFIYWIILKFQPSFLIHC